MLSGNDLTANEFIDMVIHSKGWKGLIKNKTVSWHDIKDANHTFSSKNWKEQVERITIEWARNIRQYNILMIAFQFPLMRGKCGVRIALESYCYLPTLDRNPLAQTTNVITFSDSVWMTY